MTDNNTTLYNSQEAPTRPATDADRIKALEDRIKRLEGRIEAITEALKTAEQQMQALTETAKASEQQMQTIMEALNLPEPEPAEDPARIAARAKYDAAPEDLKYGARLLTRATIFQLVDIAAKAGFPFIYAALRTGITGSDTSIDDGTLSFLKAVGVGGSKIYGGFGISQGKQSQLLADYVEAVVAGSVFVRIITENQNDGEKLYQSVKTKAEELTGTDKSH